MDIFEKHVISSSDVLLSITLSLSLFFPLLSGISNGQREIIRYHEQWKKKLDDIYVEKINAIRSKTEDRRQETGSETSDFHSNKTSKQK